MNLRKVKLLFKAIYDNNTRFFVKSKLGLCNSVSDEEFLRQIYKFYMKKELHLKNPTTFNEKLQWLKIHDHNPEYTNMVDKYEVKKYVADIIGEEYIIPTLGVWNSVDEIDFNSLPNQFVLKCTHDSGSVVICKDKIFFDIESAKKKLSKRLKNNLFWYGREWPYKNVKPRIIAEQYMIDGHDCNDLGLIDYKFFCFNGIPKFAYVAQGAAKEYKSNINMMSLNWTLMPFQRTDHPQFFSIPKKPINFDKMIEYSKKLAEKTTFVRVDFYEINSKLYFGEVTFFPGSGYIPFEPEEWDHKLGSWLELPEKH